MDKHPLHLKNPELHTTPEVERAVKREERREGKRLSNDPAVRIEAYTDRLESIFLNPDERTRKRNLDLLRDDVYDALIIGREDFPESYFELQKRIARERGQAVEDIPADVREQMKDVAIQDQKASLDAWIDYLTSSDAVYPAWFKYFVWRNVIKLSQFDKERGEFKKRTDTTVAPYPDIYREPLAQIADICEKVKEDNKHLNEPAIREAFSKKFPAFYAELISKSLAASVEGREETKGRWAKFSQNKIASAVALFESLEGKGTGWCTAGKSTAATQNESGDFYAYYSSIPEGPMLVDPPVEMLREGRPRLAIRMDGNGRIGEVRGVLPHQGVEPLMQGVLDEKLKEFGSEADAYRKKSEDMRRLTALERKREQEQQCTKDDLEFLYEVNSPIEGFGYRKDPRVAELRTERNAEEDMLMIFECAKGEIAHVPNEITARTKAYVGPLEPGIFQKLPESLEHIYTSFPEKKIRREKVEIGGRDFREFFKELDDLKVSVNFLSWRDVERAIKKIEQNKTNISESTMAFLKELAAGQINISDYAKSMLKSREVVPGKNPEEMTLIRLTVADLGFARSATTDQIYRRAQEIGLELCPPDTGPHYRLKYLNQPLGEWMYIGMKQIADSGGDPDVFNVARDDGGLWLAPAGRDPPATGLRASRSSSVSASLKLEPFIP